MSKSIKIEKVHGEGYDLKCDRCDNKAARRIYELMDEGNGRWSRFNVLKLCYSCCKWLKENLL